jgi:4-diphosphocytidyl-2-C-methyl-D-erythritol kinase
MSKREGRDMNSIELTANAKINLSLDIIGKRSDGYHNVKMIMQAIKLQDTVFLETSNNDIQIECNSCWVPSNNENIAFKAAELLKTNYNIKKGVKIRIIKNIPVAAGLAGGSADAAAVLRGMNNLFNLGISEEHLMELGKNIGADVPYCIMGGTMLAEGIGEILTPVRPLSGVNIILIKPKIGVSTAWVYKNLNLDKINVRPDTGLLLNAIETRDLDKLGRNMVNVLETVTIEKFSIINEAKKKLVELGAIGSMMSGSGPSVFGIFRDRISAEQAYNAVKSKKWECFLTETI